MMKFVVFVCMAIVCAIPGIAQAPDATALHETAKSFLKNGDYDNAILVLNRGLQLTPDNAEMQKDLLYASYLKRDFAKAKEIGKTLTDKPEADVQAFQLLGLTYKAIADYKEGEKLYKKGLKKYPGAGILYSEYGSMVAEKDAEEAKKIWEKGVEVDPNHSTNYYYMAKIYAAAGETVWSILYAETFLNMESFTTRTTEIKNLLLDEYKKFFAAGGVSGDKAANPFLTAVAEVLLNQEGQAVYGITPETLTSIRTRFILDWYNKYAATFPFRLFDHQRQLLQEGYFDSYNQWLFGAAANLAAYQLWQQYHTTEYNSFMNFVKGRVYKVPAGQQYRPVKP